MPTIRNGLNIIFTLSLLILLKVYVQCEKYGWNKPYKLLAINSKIYIINMLYKPINFKSTIIKLYYIKEEILDILKQED